MPEEVIIDFKGRDKASAEVAQGGRKIRNELKGIQLEANRVQKEFGEVERAAREALGDMDKMGRKGKDAMDDIGDEAAVAKRQVKGLGDEADRQGDRMGNAGNKGSTSFRKVAAAATAVFIAFQAIGSGFNMFQGAISAASDMEEAASKNKVLMNENADAVTEWASKSVLGFGTTEVAAAGMVGGMANLFNTIGLGADEATEKAMGMVELAADLASFHNLVGGTQQALQKIQSGLVGEAEPLRSIGVLLNEAAVSAKALEMGFEKIAGNFTEAEKVQARYALVLEQTTVAQGDFARTSDGFANSTRILSAQIGTLQLEMGKKLLPAAQGVVNVLNSLFTTADQKQVQAYTSEVDDLRLKFQAVAGTDVSAQKIELTAIFQALKDTDISFGLFKQFVSDVERLGGIDVLDANEFDAYRKSARETAEETIGDMEDIIEKREHLVKTGTELAERFADDARTISRDNYSIVRALHAEYITEFDKNRAALDRNQEDWSKYNVRLKTAVDVANDILASQGDELINLSDDMLVWEGNSDQILIKWTESFVSAFGVSVEEAQKMSQTLIDNKVVMQETAASNRAELYSSADAWLRANDAVADFSSGISIYAQGSQFAKETTSELAEVTVNYQHVLEENSRAVQLHIEKVESQKKWLDSAAYAYKQMIEQTNVEPNLSPLDNYVTKLGYVTSAGIAAQASIIATGAAAQIAYRMSKLENAEGPIDTSFIDMILANVDSTAKKLAGNTFDSGGWYDTIYNRFMQKAGGKVIGGVTDSDVEKALGGGGGGLTKEQQRISLLTEMKRMYESKDMKFDEESTDVQDALAAFEQDYANQDTDDYTQMEYDTGFRSRTDKVLDRIGRGIDADVKFSLNIKQKSQQRYGLLSEIRRMYQSKDMDYDEKSTDVQAALAAFEQDYANRETDDYAQMEYDTGFRTRTDKVLDRIGRSIDADVKFSLKMKQDHGGFTQGWNNISGKVRNMYRQFEFPYDPNSQIAQSIYSAFQTDWELRDTDDFGAYYAKTGFKTRTAKAFEDMRSLLQAQFDRRVNMEEDPRRFGDDGAFTGTSTYSALGLARRRARAQSGMSMQELQEFEREQSREGETINQKLQRLYGVDQNSSREGPRYEELTVYDAGSSEQRTHGFVDGEETTADEFATQQNIVIHAVFRLDDETSINTVVEDVTVEQNG